MPDDRFDRLARMRADLERRQRELADHQRIALHESAIAAAMKAASDHGGAGLIPEVIHARR